MVIREIYVSDYSNKQLTCIDCGQVFMWEAGEQAYFEAKNLLPPRHCPLCRRMRKLTVIVRDTCRPDGAK